MEFNWFDILTIIILLLGVLRGKKRGMSEELLDLFQWLTIIFVSALLYKPLGQFVSSYTKMDLMWSYILSYLFTFVLLKLLFAAIKRSVGEKLVHADAFGSMEYYLGMLAGAVRFACMLLMALALLHAKYISDAERAMAAKRQADTFGSISFPTLGSLQQTIFYASTTGKFVKRHLHNQLIEATPPGSKIRQSTPLDEVLR
ncbi:MAG: CvpA family protein [Verrucomicrobiales bacterium]